MLTKIMNEMNRTLKALFERNRGKYTRLYSAAKTAALRNPPVLKKFTVFEPFGNGSRFPAYTFKLTSIFGKRGRGFHRGEDLRTVNVFYRGHEVPMQSVEDGVVTVQTFSRLWGDHIIIKHPNGLETLYAHNSRVFVRGGQKVEKGRVISLSGKTGHVSGPHMHFAVRALVKGKFQWFAPSRVNWKIPVQIGIVTARGGLSLRENSRRTARRLALLPGGGAVQVIKTGRVETIGGRRAAWVKVRYHYEEGWVFSAYLDITKFKSPRKTSRKTPKKKAGAKTKKKIEAADPMARLKKLKKEELLRMAMAMGISLPTRTRKAAVLKLLSEEAGAALGAIRKKAKTEKLDGIPLNGLPGMSREMERELRRAGIRTMEELAVFKPFRAALVLSALAKAGR